MLESQIIWFHCTLVSYVLIQSLRRLDLKVTALMILDVNNPVLAVTSARYRWHYYYCILRKYCLSCLSFGTLYSRRLYLDALCFTTVFKDKTCCHSIVKAVALVCLQVKWVFCTCSVRSALRRRRHSFSVRCVVAANFLDTFNKKKLFPRRTLYRYG